MNFAADLRHAFRMLRMNPGFAAVSILTLALGIGATTAMFTVVNGVVLKSLGYPDAERIVAVDTRFTDEGRSIWRVTGGDMEDLRADQDSFEAFTYCNGGEMGVQLAKSAEFVAAYTVDPEFFHVFSISPVVGRTFVNDDETCAFSGKSNMPVALTTIMQSPNSKQAYRWPSPMSACRRSVAGWLRRLLKIGIRHSFCNRCSSSWRPRFAPHCLY